MNPLVAFLMTACRRASKLLMRDYFELEQIQNSPKSTIDFALQSRRKTEELLKKELGKYPNSCVTKSFEIVDPSANIHFLIEPLLGIKNLSRSIPFFAVVIVACELKDGKLNPLASFINFPALGEVVYAENGISSWLRKTADDGSDGALRLRVSKVFKPEEVVASFNNMDNTSIRNDTISTNLWFGCDIYTAYLVASGKLDICEIYVDENSPIAVASSMIVREAGGKTLLSDTGIILSNGLYSLKSKN